MTTLSSHFSLPLPDHWTPEQALAVYELLTDLAEAVWNHNMPRLSVDIDLTFLPVTDCGTALNEIRSQLATIASDIRRTIPVVQVQLTEADTPRLIVASPGARIKVEPSTVIRGSLFPTVESNLCQPTQNQYESCGFPTVIFELPSQSFITTDWSLNTLPCSRRDGIPLPLAEFDSVFPDIVAPAMDAIMLISQSTY